MQREFPFVEEKQQSPLWICGQWPKQECLSCGTLKEGARGSYTESRGEKKSAAFVVAVSSNYFYSKP